MPFSCLYLGISNFCINAYGVLLALHNLCIFSSGGEDENAIMETILTYSVSVFLSFSLSLNENLHYTI